MTDFDRLSRQQKCLTFYEAKAVYSDEGCRNGPLVFKSSLKGMKAHFLMKLLEFLLACEHCIIIVFVVRCNHEVFLNKQLFLTLLRSFTEQKTCIKKD